MGFAHGHSHELRAEVGERGGNEGGPEAKEAPGVALGDVFLEGAGILPVAEALAVVVWAAAEGEDEREQDQRYDRDDLDACVAPREKKT